MDNCLQELLSTLPVDPSVFSLKNPGCCSSDDEKVGAFLADTPYRALQFPAGTRSLFQVCRILACSCRTDFILFFGGSFSSPSFTCVFLKTVQLHCASLLVTGIFPWCHIALVPIHHFSCGLKDRLPYRFGHQSSL